MAIRLPRVVRRAGSWRSYVVLPLAVWLVAVLGLAAGSSWATRSGERELQHRFTMRVTIGADFVTNHVADLINRQRAQATDFLADSDVSERQFGEVAGSFGYAAAVLLDADGRLLQVLPANPAMLGTDMTARYEHLRTAVRDGRPVVSHVVASAVTGIPVVAFAVPFDTQSGRRVFSGGLQVQQSPLGSYLEHAIALTASRVYLIDSDGRIVAGNQHRPATTLADSDPVLARVVDRGGSGAVYHAGGRDWFTGSQPVPGTPWRLVATVPTAVLYAPMRASGNWRLATLAAVAVAGLVAVVAYARSRRTKRRLRESEDRRVAEQAVTNAALREAHERVADLVGMLSHDVRQPLTVITGYINTVTEDWDRLSDTRRRQFLQRANSAARRMSILVADILALTSLDAGTVHPRRAVIDVRAAITDILDQLPAEDATAVTTHLGHDDAFASVDPGHLQQMMLNLVGNALKYGQPPVDVTLTVDADALDITVSDHGEGIPTEFIPDLFARFTRANSGVAVTKAGTGLGLYIVNQLAEANHAAVTYRPNQPAGARFTLRLPTTASPATPELLMASD